MGSRKVGRGAEDPLDAEKKDRIFTGVGGKLTLTPAGDLYGAGWDLSVPYGVDYDPAAALTAPPVKIAERVISAAAGYNYGLYVTEDGRLHFVGSSGVSFAERFAFDGPIREVFAQPDRDEFRLIDQRGDAWVWGENLSEQLQPRTITPRAVLEDQVLTRRLGKAIWRFREQGEERRCRGTMLEIGSWEILGEFRRRVSETDVCRRLSAAYGENNLLFKYIRQAESPEREIRSPNWSEEAYEQAPQRDFPIPQRPGLTDQRMEAFCGSEKQTTYTVGVYTTNEYLFRPIPWGKET